MRPDPTVLAFDTSAAHCAAALLIDGRIVAQRHEEMARGQAERLFPLLEELLAEEGAAWGELDAIGVGVGPGNFTGIRIGVSAARGLSMSLGVPAIGISTFEALRMHLAPASERAVVSLDGPRGAIMLQAFQEKEADGPPLGLASLSDLRPGTFKPLPSIVVGENSDAVSFALTEPDPTRLDDNYHREPATRMVFDLPDLTHEIALLAACRLKVGGPFDRPAPLYIRPADAAAPREAPPVILP